MVFENSNKHLKRVFKRISVKFLRNFKKCCGNAGKFLRNKRVKYAGKV